MSSANAGGKASASVVNAGAKTYCVTALAHGGIARSAAAVRDQQTSEEKQMRSGKRPLPHNNKLVLDKVFESLEEAEQAYLEAKEKISFSNR